MKTKYCVLLVEDDSDIQNAIREILILEGFRVIPANHGEHALNLLRDICPDVILLDLMMPVLDGWGFMERYRKASWCTMQPVVVFTAKSGSAPNGVAEVIRKPMDLDTLIRAVMKWAEKGSRQKKLS